MAERVHVVGVGPDGLPAGGPGIPSAPDAVIAAARLVDAARTRWPAATYWPLDDLTALPEEIAALPGEVVVLASGDPGLFGVGRMLLRELGDEMVRLHPAASSMAAAFARAGVPWDDARIVSAHGRRPHAALATCLAHPVVAVLTSPDHTPARLAADLIEAGCGPRELVIAERLGHEDEQVRRVDLATAADLRVADPNVVVVLDPARDALGPPSVHAPTVDVPDRWALPTADFAHRDGQVTKPEVRALALAHLAPRTGRLVWDVGAGSGSVAVECARFGAAVVAIEADPEQVRRCRDNATSHGVRLRVVEGRAPEILGTLWPDPDAAFVGGGGPDLPAILDVLCRRVSDRIVVALASIERVGPALAQLRGAGWSADARLVAVHDLAPLGDGHRLAPHNPVVLIHSERAE